MTRAGVLLVGGGVAAVRCARTLRRRGFDGSVVIVGEERHLPYNRPPLSKELLRGEVDIGLILAEPDSWYERHGVQLRLGAAVTLIDPDDRVAELADGTAIRFGRCLLAMGAEPRRPPVAGAEHARLLRTVDDAAAVRGAGLAGTSAVLVGGGFIGVEVAASLSARGVAVTLLEVQPMLWGGVLGVEVSAWARGVLSGTGVVVRTDAAVTRIEPGAAWVGDERLEADLVVAGVGVTPRVELAAAAGLECEDGIVVDASHATSAPNVYAAGDVARVNGVRVEHWHAAREGGERAALSMLGQPVPPARAPWVFSEFAGQQLDAVGLAPRWDETRVVGEPGRGRFAVAYVAGGRIIQLAIANGFFEVEAARAFVERQPSPNELRGLP